MRTTNNTSKFEDMYVTFLPSNEGKGYTATIRKDLGKTKQGWNDWYGHLKGIAINFEPKTEWEQLVKYRLEMQFVEFN